MINGVQIKVCGLTRVEDAVVAADTGADYLGFILYPKSPRHLPLERYVGLAPALPPGPGRVAVMVEPTTEALAAAVAAGFDFFQIHFAHTTPPATLREWSAQLGPRRLWLAPKLPPDLDVPADWLPLADTVMVDTFHAGGFGGSGKTGDWAKFARHQAAHPGHAWILAGGLSPENIAEAMMRSGTRRVDVNSGVESAPGLKDHSKLRALAATLSNRS